MCLVCVCVYYVCMCICVFVWIYIYVCTCICRYMFFLNVVCDSLCAYTITLMAFWKFFWKFGKFSEFVKHEQIQNVNLGLPCSLNTFNAITCSLLTGWYNCITFSASTVIDEPYDLEQSHFHLFGSWFIHLWSIEAELLWSMWLSWEVKRYDSQWVNYWGLLWSSLNLLLFKAAINKNNLCSKIRIFSNLLEVDENILQRVIMWFDLGTRLKLSKQSLFNTSLVQKQITIETHYSL